MYSSVSPILCVLSLAGVIFLKPKTSIMTVVHVVYDGILNLSVQQSYSMWLTRLYIPQWF